MEWVYWRRVKNMSYLKQLLSWSWRWVGERYRNNLGFLVGEWRLKVGEVGTSVSVIIYVYIMILS